MTLLKRLKTTLASLTMRDISVFKITLAAFAAGFAYYVPQVLSLSVWVYVAAWLVIGALMMYGIYQQTSKVKGFFSNILDRMKKMPTYGWSIFKLYMVAVVLLIVKIFPVILTINPLWFVSIFFFGMGYMISSIVKQK